MQSNILYSPLLIAWSLGYIISAHAIYFMYLLLHILYQVMKQQYALYVFAYSYTIFYCLMQC